MDLFDGAKATVERLGVKPYAAWAYAKAKGVEYRLAGETYTVEVNDATSEFYIPTRNEFSDLDRIDERPVLADLLEGLQSDDVFYDVGANIGMYSCLAADKLDTTVVAFEPHPENADRLEENVDLNDADVSLHRCALGETDGTASLTITLDEIGSAGHTILADDGEREREGYRSVQVPVRRGDDYVGSEELPSPTVLKIDVEGAELDVLRGLSERLSDPSCRLVYCEVHEERLSARGASVSDVADYLESYGFAVEDWSVRGNQPFLRAERVEAETERPDDDASAEDETAASEAETADAPRVTE
jgi:FkbM family methyltransferase